MRRSFVVFLLLWETERGFRQSVTQTLPLAFDPLCWLYWQVQSDGQVDQER